MGDERWFPISFSSNLPKSASTVREIESTSHEEDGQTVVKTALSALIVTSLFAGMMSVNASERTVRHWTDLPEHDITSPRLLSHDAVLRLLALRGYSDFSKPRLIGRTYRLAATNARGSRKNIVIDARSGVVIHRPRGLSVGTIDWFPPDGGQ